MNKIFVILCVLGFAQCYAMGDFEAREILDRHTNRDGRVLMALRPAYERWAEARGKAKKDAWDALKRVCAVLIVKK